MLYLVPVAILSFMHVTCTNTLFHICQASRDGSFIFVVFVFRLRVFSFSFARFIVIRKCHQWDVTISVSVRVTQVEFTRIIFETTRLKKGVRMIKFLYFNCNFISKRKIFSLGTPPVRSRVGQLVYNKTGGHDTGTQLLPSQSVHCYSKWWNKTELQDQHAKSGS